ncbi:uncharacterized protein FA14DRAFT_92292 [Meira miltonrushii]|uniref:Uncharacterized protein n=1 Tax=Meira miltonrushii TaxID=1280837 RepID=A0A316V2G0_9BASI|nr:uncharacterized protein FA14DRAFT_92292 [Meira miltonrushii]PWN31700.1 hypothetical protein FA14DRAFT_92292 [Meira miltonrushii]
MIFLKLFFAVFLMVFTLFDDAKATNCQAVGTYNMNSIGFGSGGTTYSSSNGVKIYKDGNLVGSADGSDFNVCTDYYAVKSQLPIAFGWASTCAFGFFDECHGSYGDQTHIVGEKPETSTDFYGFGIDTISTCKINFNC